MVAASVFLVLGRRHAAHDATAPQCRSVGLPPRRKPKNYTELRAIPLVALAPVPLPPWNVASDVQMALGMGYDLDGWKTVS